MEHSCTQLKHPEPRPNGAFRHTSLHEEPDSLESQTVKPFRRSSKQSTKHPKPQTLNPKQSTGHERATESSRLLCVTKREVPLPEKRRHKKLPTGLRNTATESRNTCTSLGNATPSTFFSRGEEKALPTFALGTPPWLRALPHKQRSDENYDSQAEPSAPKTPDFPCSALQLQTDSSVTPNRAPSAALPPKKTKNLRTFKT